MVAAAAVIGYQRGSHRIFTRESRWSPVIAYLVETYGRERLPLLMDGVRHHDTWDELVPHAVGVSAEEFEVGWQAYVATTYGDESQTTRSP